MQPEGLCNHSDRRNHTKQQKTPHHHNQTQLTHRVTERTDIATFLSRIAAGVRHEPLRHIKVTSSTCLKKGCVTVLSMKRQEEASPLTSQRNGTIANTETATTDIGLLCSRIAAGVGHKPSRYIEVAVLTCQKKGSVAILVTRPHETVGNSRDQTKQNSSHTD